MENPSAARSVRSEPPTPSGFTTTSIFGPNTENGARHGVYLLQWTDTEIVKTNIDSPVQLQAYIREDDSPTRQLLVLHGLSRDYEAALKEVTDIDTSFFDAHIARRSYRPRRARAKAAGSHYDYPELVRIPDDCRNNDDLMSEPPTYKIPATGDSVMLCRASVWLSDKAHILFLDQASWQNSASGVSPGRYKSYMGKTETDENGIPFTWNELDINGKTIPRGDEIPHLETQLYENLRESCSSPEYHDLLYLLEDLVIDKWTDFLAALSLDSLLGTTEIAPLFSQALGCLERNLEVSRRGLRARQRVAEVSRENSPLLDMGFHPVTTEWEALLARLTRQTQFLSNLATVTAIPPRKPSAAQVTNDLGISAAKTASRRETKCCCCCYKSRKPSNKIYEKNDDGTANANTHHSIQSAENQRALNRVAYLGGVLLPFSVVSGILAIESPFGPGDTQFWIFWAVTVPLTLLTLGVIYADSIRKVQVWVEVAASGKGSSSSGSGSSDLHLGLGGSRPSYCSNPQGRVQQQRPPDIEYAIPVTGRMAQPYTISLNSAPVESASTHELEAQNGNESSDGSDDGDGDGGGGGGPEPDMIVEKRWKKDSPTQQSDNVGLDGDHWKKKKDIKWRKEELGSSRYWRLKLPFLEGS